MNARNARQCRIVRKTAKVSALAGVAIAAAAFVGGCAGSLDAGYVQADADNFAATAPYHAEYKAAFPAKAERLDRLDRARAARIEAAKRNLGLTTQPANWSTTAS